MKLKLINKTTRILTLAAIVLISFSSCKKNNIAVDKDALIPPDAPALAPNIAARMVDYYVTQVPTNPYKILVTVNNVSSTSRAYNFNYTSRSAVAGTQYTSPASLTIPAGATQDTLRFQGIYTGFSAGRKDTVKVKFDGLTGSKFYAKDSFMIVMQRYCPVVLAQLGGSYNTMEGTYGPYISQVLNLVPTGPTSATGTITNIYDSNIDATATFTWDTPSTFRVVIAGQTTQYTSGGLPLYIRTNASTPSTFSSCDNTITLNLQLYTTATIVDTWTSSMSK